MEKPGTVDPVGLEKEPNPPIRCSVLLLLKDDVEDFALQNDTYVP